MSDSSPLSGAKRTFSERGFGLLTQTQHLMASFERACDPADLINKPSPIT